MGFSCAIRTQSERDTWIVISLYSLVYLSPRDVFCKLVACFFFCDGLSTQCSFIGFWWFWQLVIEPLLLAITKQS